ncbi:MAG: HAD family phosphatase [Chloroflexota bacterium]
MKPHPVNPVNPVQQKPLMFKGIIFDFNGVLWWDSHLQQLAWPQFAATMRSAPLTEAEMAVHVYGRPNRHTLEYLLGRPITDDELHRLSEQKEAIYRRLCLAQGAAFQLSPGAIELLDFLAGRQIPRTIATSSGKPNVDFFIEHLRLDRWFEAAKMVYDDGTRPGKPAPDGYLQAARNLELRPAECIVVEDSLSGIQAARAAGVGYIIALGPPSTHHDLLELAGVNEVVVDLSEVTIQQETRFFPGRKKPGFFAEVTVDKRP